MKINWAITSAIGGIVGGILTYIFTGNWKLALLGAVIVFIIIILHDPKKRYMAAFKVVLFLILTLNKFYFEIMGRISETHFKVGANEVGDGVSIVLVFLAGLCLVLDYLERNGKLEGTIFSIKKNQVGDIKGNGNTINQTNA